VAPVEIGQVKTGSAEGGFFGPVRGRGPLDAALPVVTGETKLASASAITMEEKWGEEGREKESYLGTFPSFRASP
jgi:hypothetical protein